MNETKALKCVSGHLKGTGDKAFGMQPDVTEGSEVHVDSDWAGHWDPTSAMHDPDTKKSRHGFVMMFTGVPVMWSSRLSTSVALSSTEAECIG